MRDLARRIAAIEAVVRPRDSLAARLQQLTPQQLATYRQWQAARDEWARRFNNPASLYSAILDGFTGPQLPSDIATVLWPQQPPNDPRDEYEYERMPQ